MRRVGRVLAAGLLAATAGLAHAQQSTGGTEGLFVSPIPAPKGDPNAPTGDTDAPDPTVSDQAAADSSTTDATASAREGDDGTVAQVPGPEDEGASGADEDATPGAASQVRVVFGGSSVNQNRSLQPDEDEAEGDDAEDGDSSEPRWKRERSRRFRRAPDRDRSSSGGVQIAAPIVPIAAPNTLLQSGARLRQLDKMTGQTETFDIAVGETRRIARLQIRLEACRAPENNDTHGTMAFMQIWDTKRPEEPPAFSGWMFAESPALSALDHPRYDLWVINCTTSGAENSGSTE